MGIDAHVIVAAYNQLPQLRLALRGYLRQTTTRFALTVADDGSGDGTGDFVRELADSGRTGGIALGHVWQPDDGFRKNRVLNAALRRFPDAPLVIFSDADCIPPARFVARHVEAFRPGSFHVGGAVRLSESVSATIDADAVDSGRFETLVTDEHRRDLAKWRAKSVWGMRLRRRRRPKILGLNMAFDRRLLVAINGFDERFVGWGWGEDSDVRDRVMRLRPRPRAVVMYGENDVFHLWHPAAVTGARPNRAYYESKRPVRCELGLEPPPAAAVPGGVESAS